MLKHKTGIHEKLHFQKKKNFKEASDLKLTKNNIFIGASMYVNTL